MTTRIKTPSGIVEIRMVDANGIDGSGDYIGNQGDSGLTRDPDGEYDYVASDKAAAWWVSQCQRQVEADRDLASLDEADRDAVLEACSGIEFADLPDFIIAQCAEIQ